MTLGGVLTALLILALILLLDLAHVLTTAKRVDR